ncbi:hypothetical protein E2C01_102114 [Portunus trituberculatus]|uniref:Uncharacterized protein n=1 Tax=Portunus trituberculatus TaxID=210409 RepID=A0A5B7KM05_PORTR|nr:hypothetical protein [Portunus trituberculatus]
MKTNMNTCTLLASFSFVPPPSPWSSSRVSSRRPPKYKSPHTIGPWRELGGCNSQSQAPTRLP